MLPTNKQKPPSSFNLLLNNSGTTIIFVVVLAFICSLVIGAASLANHYALKKSGDRKDNVSAISIAEAGKEVALARLRTRDFNPEPNQGVTLYSNEPFATGTYTVTCTTNTTNDTIRIYSTGRIGTRSKTIQIIATIAPDAWKKWIRGAVTARTAISTLGNIEVDGRDYDTTGGIFGTLLGTGGTFGVAAGGTVSAGGSSAIGGNSTAPQQPALPGVTVEENIDLTGYPTTPEEVLGLPPGSLDQYKVTTCPSSNFFGIVYTDQECDFAGGILICHNAAGNASLGNYHGHFKGLIIADEDKHFNAGSSVLGAVFMLGKTAGGNCFGNGAAKIHYSSKMLSKAAQTLPSLGKRTVTVVSWNEVK